MQGRLLPPTRGRIQAFPVNAWREEFASALEAGLSCIEWIYEFDTAPDNPLGADGGPDEIRDIVESTGVAVRSVCGDYYMSDRLVSRDGEVQAEVVEHLRWLIERTALVGARYLVLPFVDASSLTTQAEHDGLAALLRLALPAAERAGIGLHLETDLPTGVLLTLMRDSVPHPLLRITCDIGNEAALGYDPRDHWKSLGPWLGSVHVKDRVLGGGTVPLGEGYANIAAFFAMFASARYGGTFILQVARGIDGDEVALARRNREVVESRWSEALRVEAPAQGGSSD
jgi:hexulose-6-phosphate isomerase